MSSGSTVSVILGVCSVSWPALSLVKFLHGENRVAMSEL